MTKKTTPTTENSKNEELKKSISHSIKLPKDFEKKHKAKYQKIKKIEVPLKKHIELEKKEYERQELLNLKITSKYKPRTSKEMTPCGNGSFEKGIDTKEWQGAYGDVRKSTSSFTEGFMSGPVNSANSHQTWVGVGTDANAPIPTTAPGSNSAVRIGNGVNGYGAELISKTFVVTPEASTIPFWYAAVMQNPIGHPPSEQPLFWVRVTDASGAIVPGAFDFGNGSDKLIADINNPFFKAKGRIVYKDWSCAQIDLTTHIGKQVTIEFISGDCGYGGHWGYAYIDRFCDNCDGSPSGTLSYDCENSDHCGKGQLCFDYTVPQTLDAKGNTVTGAVAINLDIYQNGNLITSITSPTLSSGSRYCFDLDPAVITGLNLGLNGFDFVATGKFSIASFSLGKKKIGIAPNGVSSDQNNDYKIKCTSCKDIKESKEAVLRKKCADKYNKLASYNCKCPDSKKKSNCGCTKKEAITKSKCEKAPLPKLEPCINITWGDSTCDGFETTDFEVACITVCNCYNNVSFKNLGINQIIVTDENGNPIEVLPNGKSAIEIIPSGAICFGDIPPCQNGQPACKSRELAIRTTGARSGKYRLKLIGVCYDIQYNNQKDYCFELPLCQD